MTMQSTIRENDRYAKGIKKDAGVKLVDFTIPKNEYD
jgi:hypothetical protein